MRKKSNHYIVDMVRLENRRMTEMKTLKRFSNQFEIKPGKVLTPANYYRYLHKLGGRMQNGYLVGSITEKYPDVPVQRVVL